MLTQGHVTLGALHLRTYEENPKIWFAINIKKVDTQKNVHYNEKNK